MPPPARPRDTTTAGAASGTLIDALEKAGNYTVLLAAIKQAGLESALERRRPLTIFAPTDAAFNNLFSENNITEARFLQIPELDQLLQLHVIPGRLLEADLANGQQETTLEGSNVTFTVTADGVKVNDSFIVHARHHGQQWRDPGHRRRHAARSLGRWSSRACHNGVASATTKQ